LEHPLSSPCCVTNNLWGRNTLFSSWFDTEEEFAELPQPFMEWFGPPFEWWDTCFPHKFLFFSLDDGWVIWQLEPFFSENPAAELCNENFELLLCFWRKSTENQNLRARQGQINKLPAA
jgi:hypothetical protein